MVFCLRYYADDIQLYISTNSIATETYSTLTNCLTDSKTRMHTNVFPQNCKKSEITITGCKSVTDSIQDFSVEIQNSTLPTSLLIFNLGIIFSAVTSPSTSTKPTSVYYSPTSMPPLHLSFELLSSVFEFLKKCFTNKTNLSLLSLCLEQMSYPSW